MMGEEVDGKGAGDNGGWVAGATELTSWPPPTILSFLAVGISSEF